MRRGLLSRVVVVVLAGMAVWGWTRTYLALGSERSRRLCLERASAMELAMSERIARLRPAYPLLAEFREGQRLHHAVGLYRVPNPDFEAERERYAHTSGLRAAPRERIVRFKPGGFSFDVAVVDTSLWMGQMPVVPRFGNLDVRLSTNGDQASPAFKPATRALNQIVEEEGQQYQAWYEREIKGSTYMRVRQRLPAFCTRGLPLYPR